MQEVQFDCPNCGAHLFAEWSALGGTVRCPNCQYLISLHGEDQKTQRLKANIVQVEATNIQTEAGAEQVVTSEKDLGSNSSIIKQTKGFLTFFCVSFVILAPLYELGQAASAWNELQMTGQPNPIAEKFLLGFFIVDFALIGYGTIVAYRIWNYPGQTKRSTVYRMLFVRQFGIIALQCVVSILMYASDLGFSWNEYRELFVGIVGSLLAWIFWRLYFKNSKRVKETIVIDN